jgi:hypothetical protein
MRAALPQYGWQPFYEPLLELGPSGEDACNERHGSEEPVSGVRRLIPIFERVERSRDEALIAPGGVEGSIRPSESSSTS